MNTVIQVAVSAVLAHIHNHVDKFATSDERGIIHYSIMAGERRTIMERASNGRKYPRLIYVRSKRILPVSESVRIFEELYG